MIPEAKPRPDEGRIVRSEAEVLELAREVLSRFSTRMDECPGLFFRASLTTRNDVSENGERK